MDFGPLSIEFDEAILSPRRWTLAQSEWAIELAQVAPVGDVLELCCGAGHIGLAVAVATDRYFVLVDLDKRACGFARANAESAGVTDRVTVRNSPIDNALRSAEDFAVIIADPPWVPTSATGDFPLDPLLAIDGGADGMDVARSCLDVVGLHLAATGYAVLQLGNLAQVRLVDEYLRVNPHLRLARTEMREFGADGLLILLHRV